MMRESQGYYSLLQYSDIPERAEYVNIGVILFVNQPPHILSKFSARPRRVERVFNVHLGDHFRLLQESVKSRLEMEFGRGWEKERIEKFSALTSGKLRLSPLRSVLVAEPEEVVDDLFRQLVGEVPRLKRGPRPSTKLAEAFRLRGVKNLLVKPEPVDLPGGVKIEAPFAYQNGSFNLIDAVSLAGDPDKVLNRASPRMIEGALLSQETSLSCPKRLVIIGDDADGQDIRFLNMLSRQMKEHHVGFYTIDDLDPLVSDIRKSFATHQ